MLTTTSETPLLHTSALVKLPPELHVLIASHLNPVQRVCLAVASKSLYHINSPLATHIYLPDPDTGKLLRDFLASWMEDAGLVDGLGVRGCYGKFVRRERLEGK
jgi:hypothetical protein